MEIHELNTFSGTLGAGDFFATDNGNDTSKVSAESMFAPLNARIDNIIAGPASSAEEVIDARLGANGVTYTSLGAAVRGQAEELESEISAINPKWSTTFTLKKNVDGNGNITTNNFTAITDYIPVSEGDVVIRRIQAKDSSNYTLICYVSQFSDSAFISRTSVNFNDKIVIGENTTRVVISFGRTSATGIQITQNDIDTYFNMGIYREAESLIDYNKNALINRGRFHDTGYTSLSECIDQGFYTFGSNDSVSDLPPGWSGGGLLEVFNNRDRAIWQRITGLNESYIRYSTSGTWTSVDLKHYIKAEYDGTAGDDDSVAQLNITIPRNKGTGFTRFNMGHCVDNDKNADVWRIIYAYANTRQITTTGEWECALHLADRDDFSGGIIHGDEIDQSVVAFVDGTLINISDINGYYKELRIIRSSILYDPIDHTTQIAEHGVEYIYNTDGLTIKQSVKWLVDASLTNCFLAMLPIIKAYSTQRFDDTSFAIVDNNQSNYSVFIPNAKAVTEYNANYDTFMTMEISEYPTGMTGGDRARITDNGGINYNKVYFQVCTSAEVSSGDLWKATSHYRNR